MRTPELFILFCEDTREELGGKTSLMGMLGPEINVQESGILKSLCVVGMVRCFDRSDYPAKIEVAFSADDDSRELPDIVKNDFILTPQGSGDEWTANIIGQYAGLAVFPGITVSAKLTVGDNSASARLSLKEVPTGFA